MSGEAVADIFILKHFFKARSLTNKFTVNQVCYPVYIWNFDMEGDTLAVISRYLAGLQQATFNVCLIVVSLNFALRGDGNF
jgi:hypothetical protein